MRTWRVGTFSMGASLLLLGLFLFISRFVGFDLVQVMTGWWPILLIILGLEILIYLVFSRQEKPILKYDFLSIIFVGVLGMVGIGFAIVSSTGLLGKVEEVIASEQRSFELPDFSYPTNDSVKRVVVRTVGYQMTFEATDQKEVSMFGTYRMQTSDNKKKLTSPDDVIAATQKGDTLYLNVKTLPNESGPFDYQGILAATILIPKDVKLEIIGNHNDITLKPRMLQNDWSIEDASSVMVDVTENSNIKVSANGVESISGSQEGWKISKIENPNNPGYSQQKTAVFQAGEGKYRINIANAYNVSLNTNQ